MTSLAIFGGYFKFSYSFKFSSKVFLQSFNVVAHVRQDLSWLIFNKTLTRVPTIFQTRIWFKAFCYALALATALKFGQNVKNYIILHSNILYTGFVWQI